MNLELHDREIKIRLTDRDADLLQAIANREHVPVAVLARMLLMRQLNKLPTRETIPVLLKN